MTRTRDLFANMNGREYAALGVLLFLAAFGINIALNDEFAWYARVGALVGFAGPLTAQVVYAALRR